MQVYRDPELEPGTIVEYLPLKNDDMVVDSLVVVIQNGTPDAVPIGLGSNIFFLTPGTSEIELEIYNNSDDGWSAPTHWPGRIELSAGNIEDITSGNMTEFMPGTHATITLQVTAFFDPAQHYSISEIRLYWGNEIVQRITIVVYHSPQWF